MTATRRALPRKRIASAAALGLSVLIAVQASAAPPRGVAEYTACNKRVESSPDAQLLNARYPSSLKELTPEQLVDPGRPTAKEAEAVVRLHEQWNVCREQLLNALEPRFAEHKEILMRSFAASDRVWTALVRGELSWGEANAARRQIVAQRQAEGADADRRLNERDQAEKEEIQEDLRRQKDVLDRFAAYLKQRQAH